MALIYVIAGPTASGKSTYGLELAEKLNGTLINADSLQLYNALPILTAQPLKKTQKLIPHELYGVLNVQESSTAGKWVDMAYGKIHDAFDHNKTPIILGGTGLYLKALLEGLVDIPPIQAEHTEYFYHLLSLKGIEYLYHLLCEKDTHYAQRITKNDKQRIIRALCVEKQTGKSFSEWQKNPRKLCTGLSFKTICLLPDRDILYRKCDQRFCQMIENGAIEEVETFNQTIMSFKNTLPFNHLIFKAIGFEEINLFLQKKLSKTHMIQKAQQKTRHYAKRQLTWLRTQMRWDEKINFLKN